MPRSPVAPAIPVVAGGIVGFVFVLALTRAGADDAGLPSAAAKDVASRSEARRDSVTECPGWERRVADLTKSEANLSARVAELLAADAEARFLPPPGLPPRFAAPAVRVAVDQAIVRTGITGKIEEVDCSAYPCLVVGRFHGGDKLGKLQRALAGLGEYGDDITLVAPMRRDGDALLFGAMVFPRSEARGAELVAAFRRRRAAAMERHSAPAVSGGVLSQAVGEE